VAYTISMSESFRFTPPPRPVVPPTPPQEPDEVPGYNPRARLDYLHTVNPHKKKRLWLRLLSAVLILALLAGAAVYAYPRYLKKKPAPTVATHSTPAKKPAKAAIATKHFDSSNFSLGFEYPEGWAVSDNAEAARLTVTSPVVSRKTASGTTEQVRSIMTIAPKGQGLTPFDKGGGLAVRPSEKIKFLNPTSAQRAETYLSFIQYSTTATGSSFDGIYITGDNGYEKDQYIPKADMLERDPMVVINFERCADSKCSGTPASISFPSTVWDDDSFKAPLLTLLTSLSVN
jgi:Tfp pilus assembly major pilin PilA